MERPLTKLVWDNRDLHVVVDHPNRGSYDEDLEKRIIFESKVINIIQRPATIWSILVGAGLFPSNTIARKQWTRGDLRPGMNRYTRIGKLKCNIYVMYYPDDLPIAQE